MRDSSQMIIKMDGENLIMKVEVAIKAIMKKEKEMEWECTSGWMEIGKKGSMKIVNQMDRCLFVVQTGEQEKRYIRMEKESDDKIK